MRVVRYFQVLATWLMFIVCNIQNTGSAITYNFRGVGRFGDQVLLYAGAKAMSEKYQIPLLYVPILHFDKLVAHTADMYYSKDVDMLFDDVRLISDESHIIEQDDYASILYVIDGWGFRLNQPLLNNKHMKSLLKQLIRPLKGMKKWYIPDDRISVAVHVRKGGSFDSSDMWTTVPKKFPPNAYYIEQIRYLSSLFNHEKLYVCIFTDDLDPEKITKIIQQGVNQENIFFHYSSSVDNILDDFFRMTYFDCLIRPDSSFSTAVELISDFRVVIEPEHFIVQDGQVCVDRVSIRWG